MSSPALPLPDGPGAVSGAPYLPAGFTDVQALVIPGVGHWVAEEAPEELLAAVTAFLAPYRGAGATAVPQPRPQTAAKSEVHP
jgi:hypothetical protein